MIKLLKALLSALLNCLKTLNLIYNLLQVHLPATQSGNRQVCNCASHEAPIADDDPSTLTKQAASYTEDELVTVKEAEAILKVSRWKIEDMCNKGELTIIRKGRSVRLIKAEVDAARIWYSAPKGKV